MTSHSTGEKGKQGQEFEFEEKMPKPGDTRDRVLALARHGEDFPATTAVAKFITEIASTEEASITELANIVLQDYGLTSKLLKLLNSVYLRRFGEVTTVSRAIILLGLDQLKDIVLSISLFEKLQKKNMKFVVDLVAKAIYAGIVSKKIAEALGEPNTEEIFVCSIFHHFGEFLAAYYAPGIYTRALSLMEEHPTQYRTCKAEFGEVGITIAQEWRFPSKVVACMERVRGEDIGAAPTTEIELLRLIATVSNLIAEIMVGPESAAEKKQKVERLLADVKGRYGRLIKSAETIIRYSAEDLELYWAAYGIKLEDSDLGQRLLGDRPPESKRADSEDAWRSFSVADSCFEGEETVETIFAKGMHDVTQAISEDFSVDDIFRIILETIYRGLHRLGARRTVFFMRDVKEPRFMVRLALGQIIKVGLSTVNGFDEDIIGILIREQKDLFVSNTMSEQAAPLIPAWFRSISSEPSFLVLLPITVNQVSFGFIMIEGPEDQGKNIKKHHLDNIRVLLNQIVLAIKYSRR